MLSGTFRDFRMPKQQSRECFNLTQNSPSTFLVIHRKLKHALYPHDTNSGVLTQETHGVFVMETCQLMLFCEKIFADCDNQTRYRNTGCEQGAAFHCYKKKMIRITKKLQWLIMTTFIPH